MKHLITIAAMLTACTLQTACTTTTAQLYAGYESAAKKGLEAADDNNIRTLTDGICGVPYGAVIRNSQFIPLAKAACLPAGGNSAPDSLLPTAQPQGMASKAANAATPSMAPSSIPQQSANAAAAK